MNWTPSRIRVAFALILALYLVLAVGRAVTDAPTEDEGWFACPAVSLLATGHMTTSVLDLSGTWGAGLGRHTYWTMPLTYILQAGWYGIFGFSLFAMRSLSILLGLGALASYWLLMRKLTGDTALALLAAALIAVDFSYLRAAASGRMDMLSASLAVAAYASYFCLRERRFRLALLAANSFAAANCVAHPNALLGLLALWAFVIGLDRRRLSPGLLGLSLVPYLLASGAWAVYILQDPADFNTQFFGNSGHRLWGLSSPVRSIVLEIQSRYTGYGFGVTAWMRYLLLAVYLLGAAMVVATRQLRGSLTVKVLLVPTAITAFYFTFFEGTKLHNYGVHVTPLLACLLAVAAAHAAKARIGVRAACVILLAFSAVGAAGTVAVVKRDSLHQSYLPVTDYLRQHWDRKSMLWGGSELAFQLGYLPTLVDDSRLGYYSGRRAEWIVYNRRYRNDRDGWRLRNPGLHDHIVKLLAREYEPVQVLKETVIYRRR